jgi:hypothetical protein
LEEQPEKTELWEYEGVDRSKTLKRILNTIRICDVGLSFFAIG